MTDVSLVADFQGWTARNEHWLARSHKALTSRAARERPREPLVLCGHGVKLSVHHGALIVRNGFTHYPQQQETLRLFKGDRTLPPRIIMLDGSGSISFEVLAWLGEQNIPLIRIGWQGDVISTIGGPGSTYLSERIAWQTETRNDPEARLSFCCDLIAEKVCNSVTTMRTALPNTPARTAAIEVAEIVAARLDRRQVRSVMDIHMAEARAAGAYFKAWKGMPLRWKGLKQRPVPERWLTAETRRSYSLRIRSTNRNASHPVNAMLNYGYAVLHSQVQAGLVADGYDPARGVMHESRLDSRAFVLDMIEPGRPAVDAAVLKFVAANALSASDFAIRSDGVCRLAPQLTKRLCEIVGSLRQTSVAPGHIIPEAGLPIG